MNQGGQSKQELLQVEGYKAGRKRYARAVSGTCKGSYPKLMMLHENIKLIG